MQQTARALRLGALFVILSSALAAAGCGGGGSTPSASSTATAAPTATSSASAGPTASPTATPVPTPTPTPVPTVIPASGATAGPTAAPSSVVQAISLNNVTGFPTVGGIGYTLSFAATPVPAGVIYAATAYNGAPPVAVPTNVPKAQPSPVSGSPVVLYAATFANPSTAVTVRNGPTQTFLNVPAQPGGKAYYTYSADVTAGVSFGFSGPYYADATAVVTAAPATASGTTTLPAGDLIVYELVYF